MKSYNSVAIKEALYNTFAYRLGPDGWEKLETEFWDELETSQHGARQVDMRDECGQTGITGNICPNCGAKRR